MVRDPVMTRTLSFVQENKLFSSGEKIIIGVSGGADSVALLHILYQLRHELGTRLIVAHFDHGLRKSSKRDQAFVRKMAISMGLPFVTAKGRVLARGRGSIEDKARQARYGFFARVVKKEKAAAVAIAHTRDDLAETVLMRLLRGTGTEGLQAIRPVRELNGVKVVRPLLQTSRIEVEKFLRQRKLTYVSDPTNRSMQFFRNRIRHKVLPLLNDLVGGELQERLAALANVAAADQEFIADHVERAFKSLAHGSGKTIRFPLMPFSRLPLAIRRGLVRKSCGRVGQGAGEFELKHIENVLRMAERGALNAEVHLPRGVLVKRTRTVLTIKTKACSGAIKSNTKS